ncbi:hypothetical protein KI387_042097, partial [Taxus chinensis]
RPVISSTSLRRLARWYPPVSGFHKLKFDGAARGNPNALGVGYIVRNDRGLVVGASSFKLRDGTCNSAELQALRKGLELVASLKVENLEI